MKRNILSIIIVIVFCDICYALDAPTITATARGPNQINLTWSAVTNPGWGYKVEMQSDDDNRYLTWTEVGKTRDGRDFLPYWVTEGQYLDVTNGTGTTNYSCSSASSTCGTAAQWMQYGLKYGTTYNFRVRSYGQTDLGVDTYSSYSTTDSATTSTPSTIRHVRSGGPYGSGNGTSYENAWGHIYNANSVTAGTLVLVYAGNYTAERYAPSNSGTQANRIIIQSNPGFNEAAGTVTITTIASGNYAILLDTNYVTVDGINMDATSNDQRISIGGVRNALVNSEFDGRSSGYADVVYIHNKYNLVHSCSIHDGDISDPNGGFIMSIFTANGDCNVVQYNHLWRGGHDTGIMQNGADRNKWLNNQHDGSYGLGIEVVPGGTQPMYNLIEGSIFEEAGQSQPSEYKPTLEISSANNTARRNLLFHGQSHGFEVSYASNNNNLIYNNVTVYHEATGLDDFSTSGSGTVVSNNIFFENDGITEDWAGEKIEVGAFRSTSPTFEYNCILGVDGASQESCARVGVVGTVSYANSNWSNWNNNITTAPDMIDPANKVINLKSTSGLIGAGTTISDPNWPFPSNETDISVFKYYEISESQSQQPIPSTASGTGSKGPS